MPINQLKLMDVRNPRRESIDSKTGFNYWGEADHCRIIMKANGWRIINN